MGISEKQKLWNNWMKELAEKRKQKEKIESEKTEAKPKRAKRARRSKPVVRSFICCRKHKECRKVKKPYTIFELVNCPWCNAQVDWSNIGKWCSNCYCKFEVINNEVHFGKQFTKSFGEALAIAMAKSGGMKFGDINNK